MFFNRLAEIAGEYLKSGSKVYIEGSLRTRKWQDKNGIERYTTEIVANEMQMLSARSGGSHGSSSHNTQAQAHNTTSAPTSAPQAKAATATATNAAPAATATASTDEDDIPF